MDQLAAHIEELYNKPGSIVIELPIETESSFNKKLLSYRTAVNATTIYPDGTRKKYMKYKNNEKCSRFFYYRLLDVYSLHAQKCDEAAECIICNDQMHIEFYVKNVHHRSQIVCDARDCALDVTVFEKKPIDTKLIQEEPDTVTLSVTHQFECQGCTYTLVASATGCDAETASKAQATFKIQLELSRRLSTMAKVRKIMDLFGQTRTDLNVSIKSVSGAAPPSHGTIPS